MSERAQAIGLAQAQQLVGRLHGADIIQPPHEGGGIHRAHTPGGKFRERIADVGGAGQIVRQERSCCGAVGRTAQVKVRDPVILRGLRTLVPVVLRLVQEQARTRPGLKPHETVRGILQRHPHLERCVRLEGVGAVVLEDLQQRAGVHQEGGEAGGLQRPRGTLAECPKVGSKRARKLRLQR